MGRQQEEKEKEQHYNETGTVVPVVGRQPCQSFYLFSENLILFIVPGM